MIDARKEAFTFTCPNVNCSNTVRARTDDIGKEAHCPRCGKKLTIPERKPKPAIETDPIFASAPRNMYRYTCYAALGLLALVFIVLAAHKLFFKCAVYGKVYTIDNHQNVVTFKEMKVRAYRGPKLIPFLVFQYVTSPTWREKTYELEDYFETVTNQHGEFAIVLPQDGFYYYFECMGEYGKNIEVFCEVVHAVSMRKRIIMKPRYREELWLPLKSFNLKTWDYELKYDSDRDKCVNMEPYMEKE